MRKLKTSEMGRVSVEDFRKGRRESVIVAIENIRSGYNVGSIFRTADAFAVQEIWITGYSPRPPHKEVLKTSLGSEKSVPWIHLESSGELIQRAKSSSFRLLAVEQTTTSLWLHEFKPDGPVVFVFGNEVTGVSDEVIARCDGAVAIPQFGTKHSLNVSVAAGIVLWQWHLNRLK
jgi:tRNA G18 (ribose-2'-O)-methylase SpoU